MPTAPLISVIVSVYNIKDYVGDCVDSIITQSYTSLEIILVDDGATDGSGELCDKLAEKDSRIKVVHKQNGGLSSARNAGLKACSGEYVSFIDGDDELEVNMYELMLKDALSEAADIVVCGCKIIFKDKIRLRNGTNVREIWNRQEALAELLTGKRLEPSVWDKLYKRTVIGELVFDEKVKQNEDLPFNYQVFKNASKTVYHDLCLYRYKKREGSLTKSGFTSREVELVQHIEDLYQTILKETPELWQSGVLRYVMALVSIYNHSYRATGYESLRDSLTIKLEAITGNVQYYNCLPLVYRQTLFMITHKIPLYPLLLKLRTWLKRV